MQFKKTEIDGVWIIETSPFRDDRGYFTRIFCEDELAKNGIKFNIVQINRSFTKNKGVIRGLHFQLQPKSEEKIVQCISGSFFQVVVDLRASSPTRGKWTSVELSDSNQKAILIPKGCAAGIQTLSENCGLLYFMSEFYSAENASGVRYDDPAFDIKWQIFPPTLVSDKDKTWPLIADSGWPKL